MTIHSWFYYSPLVLKIGYDYYRSSLIKILILSVAFPFILYDYFSGNDTKSEPAAIYLILAIWFLGVGFLVVQMRRTRHRKGVPAATHKISAPH